GAESSDLGHFYYSDALGRRLNAFDQRAYHLPKRDQPQAPRRFSRAGQPLQDPIDWDQQIGPTVAGAKDVPRSQDSRLQSAVEDHRFHLGPDFDVPFHRRSRMRDADVDEMANAGFDRGGYGLPRRDKVDGSELASLGGRRMGYAD